MKIKIIVLVLYYLSYAFLFWVSWLGIIAGAMNRDTSFIAEFGFYLFLSILIGSPVVFYFLIRLTKLRWLIIAGMIPLLIYAGFFGYYLATHDVYF